MSTEIKHALITGASRGIGRAICLQLAKLGYHVTGTATTQAGADAISQYLSEADLVGQGFMLNITDRRQIDAMLKQLQSDQQMPSILVNNAAITRDNLMIRMSDDEWDDVIATNLTGIFHMTKGCLKPMMKARWGRIISISSVVGTMGNPGQCNYAAAKAGLVGFSKSLAQEVASRNITVNVVAPGFIDTDMSQAISEKARAAMIERIPSARLGSVDDIAHGVAYLASDNAGYITGHTLHINGGINMV